MCQKLVYSLTLLLLDRFTSHSPIPHSPILHPSFPILHSPIPHSLIPQEVVEDLNGDPEENSSHYMAVLIEALSTLGKVEEALDVRMCSLGRE